MVWNFAEQAPIEVDHVCDAREALEAELEESFFRVRADRTTTAELQYLRAMAELGPEPQLAGDVAEVLGVGIIVHKGLHAFSLHSFAPSTVFSSGIGPGLVFAFNCFIGFEATAIFAEEAKHPRQHGIVTLLPWLIPAAAVLELAYAAWLRQARPVVYGSIARDPTAHPATAAGADATSTATSEVTPA